MDSLYRRRDVNVTREPLRRSEYAKVKEIRRAFATAVQAKDIQAVMRVGREVSQIAHGKDHTLWDAYYNAVRLCWTAPGAGYTSRAITPRALTAANAQCHIPEFDNAYADDDA